MAIQISGTTVIDNSRNFTNLGSGSFASPVSAATPTSGSHATTKSYVDGKSSSTAGEVLQVVQTTYTAQTTSNSTYSWSQITGLNRTITTTQTNSRILLFSTVCTGGQNDFTFFAFSRDGSRIGTGAGAIIARSICGGAVYIGYGYALNSWSGVYLDSPGVSSGTTLTYGMQFTVGYNDGDNCYINRTNTNSNQTYDGNGRSNIICMEIAP